MANGMPSFLQDMFNQLLNIEELSQEDFKDRYRTGYIDPGGSLGGGRTRYFYDYDFEDTDKTFHSKGRGSAKRKGLGTTIGAPEGYRFYSEDDAYNAYLQSVKNIQTQQDAVDIFDPQSLLSGIERAKGIDPGEGGKAEMFTAFTPEMFRQLQPGYYQEDIQEGRGSLLDTLTGNVAKAKSLGGNLAGYGRRQKQEDVARGSYLGGMEDVYSGVDDQRASALQNIYDVLSQYRTIGDMG
tara:strand:- start:9572 stop:10288 length:717 start_codon:yes stop_codon:yes gene_type:complete